MLAAIVLLTAPKLELVASAPLPEGVSQSYSREAVVARAPSLAVVFETIVNHKAVVLRFDPGTKRLEKQPGYFTNYQSDCGRGLASLIDGSACTTYDVATNQRLSILNGQFQRVGAVLTESKYLPAKEAGAKAYWSTVYYDAITGDQIREGKDYYAGNVSYEDVPGALAWDTEKRRLFVKNRKVANTDDLSDTKDLIVAKPGEFKGTATGIVTEYAIGFDRIIGNPDGGWFVVVSSGTRRDYYKTFNPDGKVAQFQLGKVTDIGPLGVLGWRILKELDYGYTDNSNALCADKVTGKTLWETKTQTPMRWVGEWALQGKDTLDGRTGRKVAELPKDAIFIANRGSTIWLVNHATKRLEVWWISR